MVLADDLVPAGTTLVTPAILYVVFVIFSNFYCALDYS